LELAASFDPATSLLTVAAENRSSEPVIVPDIRLVAGLHEPAIGGWAHLHGRYMQQDALTRVFGADPEGGYSGDFLEAGTAGTTCVSREVVALHLPSRPLPALVIGSLRTDRFFCDIRLHCSPGDESLESLSLSFPMEGTRLVPGERLALPPILIGDGHDSWRLLEAYADRVADEMGARVPATVPTGWCSWYFFYNRVSEADILANLDVMRSTNHPADYVQVDDGYQSHTGDWLLPNEKFPSGMASVAERISAAGYRPGLWLAPFVMHRDSAVLREHPEFALTTSAGAVLTIDTWLGPCAVLDCTHPGAAAWLAATVHTVVSGWGYTFLKLDALAFAAQPGDRVRYHTPGTTALQNIRRGLEIIRAAAGDETFILGCTCHFGPAVGLVDAMRVGPDVKAVWNDGPRPSVRHAMRMSLQRNWMHRRWWLNDPDCLVLRDAETELNAGEVRFLAAAVGLSGGLVVSSDDLPALSDERAALTRFLMPPAGVAATPIEPGEGPVPSAWRARLDETRSLIGVLNWSEESRWVSPNEFLEPGEVAFAPWTGQVLGKGDLLLQPHEGTLWQVSAPSPTPRLVGDSGHVNYHGLFVRPVSGRLQVRNDGERRRTVAVDARGRIALHELSPGEARWFE
jgi:alpha-galactosidase